MVKDNTDRKWDKKLQRHTCQIDGCDAAGDVICADGVLRCGQHNADYRAEKAGDTPGDAPQE